MKITFLGTSHGIPGVDRFCSCTMIEIGERVYLIDGGAPVADLLVRHGIPFSRVRAVFTTHMHSDHTIGLPLFCSLSNWKFKDASFDIFLAEEEGCDIFRSLIRVTDRLPLDESRIRFRVTVPGVFYSDDNITVTAIPTAHMNYTDARYSSKSYALVVDAEGKRVVFTGDMRVHDPIDFPEIAKREPSDAIVCEMAHFRAATILPILAACPTKQVLMNHVGYFGGEDAFGNIEAAAPTFPVPMHAVTDGETLEV